MKLKTSALAFIACGAIGSSFGASAADFFVISNTSMPLTAAELREVFLGERQFAGGRRLVPIDNASIQADFVGRVVGIEASKYVTVWAKKGFREGLNPPELKAGDQDVIAAVRSTPGAIGYVSRVPQGMHVIEKY